MSLTLHDEVLDQLKGVSLACYYNGDYIRVNFVNEERGSNMVVIDGHSYNYRPYIMNSLGDLTQDCLAYAELLYAAMSGRYVFTEYNSAFYWVEYNACATVEFVTKSGLYTNLVDNAVFFSGDSIPLGQTLGDYNRLNDIGFTYGEMLKAVEAYNYVPAVFFIFPVLKRRGKVVPPSEIDEYEKEIQYARAEKEEQNKGSDNRTWNYHYVVVTRIFNRNGVRIYHIIEASDGVAPTARLTTVEGIFGKRAVFNINYSDEDGKQVTYTQISRYSIAQIPPPADRLLR